MAASAPVNETYSPGLEGVIAGETAISTVVDGLQYRGYRIDDLAEHATYDETAYLLLHGELPTSAQLQGFQQRMKAARSLPPCLIDLLRAMPSTTHPMDAVRSAISVLAHFDPETEDLAHAASVRKAERLLGAVPVAVALRYRFSKGLPPIPSQPDLPRTVDFLHMVQGTPPSPDVAKAFDVSLILYAEHEFNASTFTARVVCSTLSDLHSALVAATGALKGPLHGGANEKVMDVLRAIGDVDRVRDWLKEAYARKERIMGFGHRVYKHGDVRARILKGFALSLAAATNNGKWEAMAEIIEETMEREKNLLPNLDWPAGRLYHAMGLETPLYTPIFVMSRIAGWSAHVIEQLDNNRLIRPRSRYVGPEVRPVVPLGQRG